MDDLDEFWGLGRPGGRISTLNSLEVDSLVYLTLHTIEESFRFKISGLFGILLG